MDVPEHRLMLAVLEDAVLVFRNGLDSGDPTRRKESFEVARWVIERDSDSLFSFENVCRTLQLDPDYIRSGLLGLKRRPKRAFRLYRNRRPPLREPESRPPQS